MNERDGPAILAGDLRPGELGNVVLDHRLEEAEGFLGIVLGYAIEPLLQPMSVAVNELSNGFTSGKNGFRWAMLSLVRPFLAFPKASGVSHRLLAFARPRLFVWPLLAYLERPSKL